LHSSLSTKKKERVRKGKLEKGREEGKVEEKGRKEGSKERIASVSGGVVEFASSQDTPAESALTSVSFATRLGFMPRKIARSAKFRRTPSGNAWMGRSATVRRITFAGGVNTRVAKRHRKWVVFARSATRVPLTHVAASVATAITIKNYSLFDYPHTNTFIENSHLPEIVI
jgi:hypothetical protein